MGDFIIPAEILGNLSISKMAVALPEFALLVLWGSVLLTGAAFLGARRRTTVKARTGGTVDLAPLALAKPLTATL